MKLLEYEAKEILKDAGVPVPKGILIRAGDDAGAGAAQIGELVVVKAQIDVGGRGKAGGILMADSATVQEVADRLLGSRIKDVPVHAVLVEERISIEHEYYLSISIDRSSGSPLILFTSSGGVEIEEVARTNPDAIRRAVIHPLLTDVPGYTIRYLLDGAPRELGPVINKLYHVFRSRDALLAEINPLVTTPSGVYAADGKIIIDDNALARQGISENRDLTDRERKAEEFGFSFVELDGSIGVIGNGAGLTMATVDLITVLGGKPANFLDVGGGADRVRVAHAVQLLGSMPGVSVIIVNLLGGITRCDEVAAGIIDAGVSQQVIVRLAGTNEEQGREMLNKHGYRMLDTMEEAVSAAVEVA
ncbi:succinate--CoA ligase subunit beta [Methanospirillum lacunae]|uniref:Succinyl-CoA synthetase subunit beta n=1 Tax=Methanospirillum lacunae TaxID=668570 RepID=A0A2V2NB57_9EURY|nr:ATP-grasp domain-containing protein [Methanospirillum lacunae]PWR72801.1 succinyl-CoA synthetase subunit beta [Methanospirillum lacunae]